MARTIPPLPFGMGKAQSLQLSPCSVQVSCCLQEFLSELVNEVQNKSHWVPQPPLICFFSSFHSNLLHCPTSPWNPCSKLSLPTPGLAQVEEHPPQVTALTVNLREALFPPSTPLGTPELLHAVIPPFLFFLPLPPTSPIISISLFTCHLEVRHLLQTACPESTLEIKSWLWSIPCAHCNAPIHDSLCCVLPEKLTYTFLKSKKWVYYSLKLITSESTKQATVLESVSGHRVAANLHFFPVLGHCQVPRLALGQKLLFSGKGSGQRLELTQQQLHTHTLHPAPTLVLSYPTSPHSFSPREHQHCKSRALLIPSAPPIPFWREALAWCRSTQTHTALHWVNQHTLPFSTSDLILSFFWQWEQKRANNPKPCSGA